MEAENRRAVLAATVAAGLLVASQVAGKSVRDALFLSTFSVAALPPVMMASSLASLGAVVLLSRAMRRASPFRVEPLALGLSTLLLGVWWLLSLGSPRVAALAFYLHMALFGATLISGFWSVVNERFDPYTAKRAVGGIGLGASVGGVAGGFLAWGAAGILPVSAMLMVMAGLNLASLVCVKRLTAAARTAPAHAHAAEAADSPTAFKILTRVPYVRDLALLVGLSALAEALLDYVLKAYAAGVITRGPQLMSFFALFHTATGVIGLLAQTFFGGAALRVLGLAGTTALRPALVFLGAVLGIFDPRLRSAVFAYGSQEMLSNSLFRSGYELLYTPIPEAEKRPAKAVVDVGFDKLGALVGGALTFAVVAVAPTLALRVLCGLVALLSLFTLALSGRLQRGYVATLEQSLRAGKVRLDASDVQDEATLLTLAQTNLSLDRETLLREIEALRGGGPGETRPGGSAEAPADPIPAGDPLLRSIADLRSGRPDRVREALKRPLGPALVPHLVALLARNDLFLEVLRALRTLAPLVTGQLVDTLLDTTADPVVRRRVPRVLKACATQRAADGLRLGLEDARFDVRAQCALALSGIVRKNPAVVVPREAAFAAALLELERGASSWAPGQDSVAPRPDDSGAGGSGGDTPPRTSVDRGLDHVFTLLSLVLEREPLQIALLALRSADQGLRGTALEYLENVLPDNLRRALWKHIGARPTARSPRARQEVVDDLLRSMDSLTIDRKALRAKVKPE